MLISGVPERRDEDLRAIVYTIGSFLRVDVAASDVTCVFRVGKDVPDNTHPRSFLVKFSAGYTRDLFLRQKRKRGLLTVGKVFPGFFDATTDTWRININEGLTRSLRDLYYDVRKFANSNHIKKCWVRGGAIYLLKDDNSRPMRIRCSNDLRNAL